MITKKDLAVALSKIINKKIINKSDITTFYENMENLISLLPDDAVVKEAKQVNSPWKVLFIQKFCTHNENEAWMGWTLNADPLNVINFIEEEFREMTKETRDEMFFADLMDGADLVRFSKILDKILERRGLKLEV